MDQNDQMDVMFKSSRTDEVDPVSGNEVPTGSLPEEVRDDIPAQLSEGEYVVPADVVRYFGVKFFEDIRTQAKQGFQELEQGGRIGGDPVGMEMGDDELPFDISELQMVDDGEPEQPMMNKGGYVSGYNDGGDVTQMKEPDFLKNSGYDFGSLSGTELIENRTYVNEAGLTMVIRFVDGVPDVPIPAGYTLQGSAVEEAAPTVSNDRDDDDSTPVVTPPKEKIDWATAGIADYDKAMKNRDSLLSKAGPGALGLVSPILGIAAKMAKGSNNRSMIAGLDAKLANKALVGDDRAKLQGYYDTLIKEQDKRNKDTKLGLVEKSGIFGGESTMYEKLEDTDGKAGASFGDTWLGDLLGFDEGGAGVQGDNLKDSRAGSRRDGVTSGGTPSSTPTASSGKGNSFFQNVANSFTPNDGKSYVNGELKDDEKDK
jgi:hypothetical protein